MNDKTINLFDVGALVNLSISCWSGRKMLTREDFKLVGLNPDELPNDLCNLGRKLLVPKSELKIISQLEQRARAYLASYSVPFGMASAHFVPMKMLPNVDQFLTEIKKEFFGKVDSFIARFEDMKKEVQKAHPEFWDRCLKNHYPRTPGLLRSNFRFSWHIFKVAGIDSIQETNIMKIVEEDEKKQIKNTELRKQLTSEVESFVQEYVSSMRTETIRFCELMSARVNNRPYGDETEAKKLTARSLAYFGKYVNKFKQMNIFEDNEIEKMLSEFKDQFLPIGIAVKDFDNSNMASSVTNSLKSIREKAASDLNNESQFINSLKRRITI